MNKYITLMVFVLYLVLITLVVGSLGMTTTTEIIGGVEVSQDASILSVFGFIGAFFRIITFQIDNIPVMITAICFYPVTIAIVYMVADIIKDIIPFT